MCDLKQVLVFAEPWFSRLHSGVEVAVMVLMVMVLMVVEVAVMVLMVVIG